MGIEILKVIIALWAMSGYAGNYGCYADYSKCWLNNPEKNITTWVDAKLNVWDEDVKPVIALTPRPAPKVDPKATATPTPTAAPTATRVPVAPGGGIK